MSSSSEAELSTADWLRMAIAVTALQHKPADKSMTSYVLDLRAKFLPFGPSRPTSDQSWRARALQLERNYAMLQAQYEAERIKNIIAVESAPEKGAADAGAMAVSSQACATPSKPDSKNPALGASKRKQKKKLSGSSVPAKEQPISLEMIFETGKHHLRERFGLESLASAVDSIFRLTTVFPTSAHVRSHISAATVRSLGLLSKELRPVLTADEHPPVHLKKLEHLARVLESVLPVAIPDIVERSELPSLDVILGRLLNDIALPAITSFLPLSERLLQNFMQPSMTATNNENSVDIRYGVLDFLRTSLSCLFAITRQPCMIGFDSGTLGALELLDSLRMSLVLETLKELLRILNRGSDAIRGHDGRKCESAHHPSLTTTQDEPRSKDHAIISNSPTNRRKANERRLAVTKLAVKDAIWFLCTILHSLSGLEFRGVIIEAMTSQDKHQTLDPSLGYGKSLQRTKSAIRDALLNLVVQCQAAQGSYRARRPLVSSYTEGQGTAGSLGANLGGAPTPKLTLRELSTDYNMGQAPAQKGRAGSTDDVGLAPSCIIEEGLVDETAYAMLLGVVEKFMMTTI